MHKILHWMKEEAIAIIPAIIYFCIVFNLIHFTTGLALRPDDVRYFGFFSVTFGAILAGKVVIIVNSLPFYNAFPDRPMIYNIVWKSIITIIVIFMVWYLDALFHLLYDTHSFALASEHIKNEFFTKLFWATQLWLWIVFILFIGYGEFARVLGKKNIIKMLLG